jgi:hypothetical protein
MKTLTQILQKNDLDESQIETILSEYRGILPKLKPPGESRISNMGIQIYNETILQILNLL